MAGQSPIRSSSSDHGIRWIKLDRDLSRKTEIEPPKSDDTDGPAKLGSATKLSADIELYLHIYLNYICINSTMNPWVFFKVKGYLFWRFEFGRLAACSATLSLWQHWDTVVRSIRACVFRNVLCTAGRCTTTTNVLVIFSDELSTGSHLTHF